MQPGDERSGPGSGSGSLSSGSLHTLHIDQTLRHINLIIRLKHQVLVGMAFFNDAFEIDREVFTVFASDLHLAFIGKIAKPTRANNSFADGITFIRRNLLRPLALD